VSDTSTSTTRSYVETSTRISSIWFKPPHGPSIVRAAARVN
jgi:hypothetical protein